MESKKSGPNVINQESVSYQSDQEVETVVRR
jgi:hypothetical protein